MNLALPHPARTLTAAALCSIAALWWAAPAAAGNSFLVAPGRIDLDLERPQTRSFIVTNTGDGPIRVTVEPVYFPVDDSSLQGGVPLKPETAGQDSLTPFLRVSPRTLSLKPGERRDVRFSIRNPADLPPGDYRVHLLMRMLETAVTLGNDQIRIEGDRGIAMQLHIKMETAVAIYGHKGARHGEVAVACRRAEDGTLRLEVTNATPWRYEGRAGVFAAGAAPDAAPLNAFPFNSLRESRRTVPTRWQPPAGTALEVRWEATQTAGPPGSAACLTGE